MTRADRWLMPLVGLVVSAGVATVAWAVSAASWSPAAGLHLVVVAALVAVASGCSVAVTRRQQALSATSAAVLVAVALLPAPWVVLTTAAGVMVAKVLRQRQPHKIAFNVSKDVLGAAAGAAVACGLGWRPDLDAVDVAPEVWPRLLVALVAAAAVYAVTEEALVAPVVALATGRRWWQVAAADADLRTGLRLVDLVLAVVAVALVAVDGRLLAALPPSVLAVHSAYGWRIRDRAAWERLSAAIAELGDVDVDRVAAAGAVHASRLFGCDAEVDYPTPAGRRHAYAAAGELSQRGPASAPALEGTVLRLAGLDGPAWLRLGGGLAGPDRRRLAAFGQALAAALATAGRARHLTRLAYTDPLTGLANRRALLDLLDDDTRRGQLALGLVDLDGFKAVNDTHGHDIGDLVITACAHRLRTAVPDAAQVARLGGDEFAVLVDAGADVDECAALLLAALTAPLAVDDVDIAVGASIGWATGRTHTTASELLRAADTAMYQAKRSGSGVAYAPGALPDVAVADAAGEQRVTGPQPSAWRGCAITGRGETITGT
ncbi:GGDEF domain-containing protein [Polymorphospora sp. NPDC050346]|uniref:GGDEF domain-containing protein n=1 Tax=Polymorphospora sp. NPDC050346 TaxID=3155780 RepID=UPI0033CC5832